MSSQIVAPTPRYLSGAFDQQALVEAFNQFQRETIDAISSITPITRRSGLNVVVDAVGAASMRVKTGLRKSVGDLVPSRMRRLDGQPIEAMWGWDWENIASGEVLVTFFGLVDSSAYVCNLIMIQGDD